MRKALTATLAGVLLLVTAGAALADFSPKFEMKMSDTKVNGHPAFDLHLEFDAEDEEIGNFTMTIPKGFKVAADEDIADDEEIGGGEITIQAGPACRPDAAGGIPLSAPVNVSATIYERDRSDAEADEGVHAVWFLDLEPLNRVRLLVRGSETTGWSISGAPTPSDNTCNPLIVDLSINSESESGVPLVTNPAKAGKKKFTAEIASQDSPAVAKFTQVVKITK